MYGWCGKILRINLTDGRISVEVLDPKLAKDYMGGRGLGSKYLFDEVDPKVDPLSPENKLILAAGAVSGTRVPTGGRYMVITKAPLTGTVASSNSGGFWGAELKHAGYDMIIVEGKAKEPVYLWLENDKAELRSAEHIWGKNTFEAQDIIRRETDKAAKITCIGPAGEKLVKFACLINDEGRAPGRSGIGAVMGSKYLKAVAVKGTKEVPVADERGLRELTGRLIKILSVGALKKYGTCYSVRFTNGAGVLPTRNFRTGVFEGAEKICGEVINEHFVVRTSACYRCPMGCGRITKVTDSGFEGEGPGPEYEGVFSLGSCCGIDNPAAIIKAFHICNELGMDVMSCGVTIACAMEMCEDGIIPEKDVGFKLNFGDDRALVELVKKVGYRDGFGDALAEGSKRLAEKYDHPEFSMTVKGQEPAGYDPRGLQGMALGYATSNRGACHLRGEISNAEVFGLPFKLNGLTTQGKAAYLITMQNEAASIDSMGICWLCSSYRIGKKNQLDALELVTGAGYDWEEFLKVGERIWNLERLFNNNAGFTELDDTLPRRFLEEPLPEGPAKGAVARLGEMIFEYYMFRGWTTKGEPTRRKLIELGIET
jgi:aldehyde:ferredoxin oxidoreductase